MGKIPRQAGAKNAYPRGASCETRHHAISGVVDPFLPASPRVPLLERVVPVSASGHQFSLPEYALEIGLSDLRLATGECFSLEDYASGVGLVLAALARSGMLGDLAAKLSRD